MHNGGRDHGQTGEAVDVQKQLQPAGAKYGQ